MATPVLTIALPGHRGPFSFSATRATNCGQQNQRKAKYRDGNSQKNLPSNIRTSTVLKGPHPELLMSGGKKPRANASATGASAI